MRILRVDMGNLTTSFEDLPDPWKIVGGRALTAKILNAEVPPDADALGPKSKLVMACGPLAGTKAPSCGRLSIGAKSPLTFGIKEANTGGPVGQKLDRLGIRALVVEGIADKGKFYLLEIDKEKVSLVDANTYRGMKNYDLATELRRKYHPKASIVSVGPAGEKCWKSAAITLTDKDGHSSRHAARGGLGAVMGSKGLKAVVIDDRNTPKTPLVDEVAFRTAVKNWAEITREDKTLEGMGRFGTTGSISALRWLGSMPSKNYTHAFLEGIENISGEAIAEKNRKRGGKTTNCMPGCLVGCSVVYHDADGNHLTSSLEYETIALMGTNLGIVDPDVIARLDRLSDDLGVDTIEIGSALGVAAGIGKMKMGDADSVLALLDEIERGTELGATLANGVVATCKAFNVTRIPAYKGQAIPAHDPRIAKSAGVSYATSPMGADHTAGISYDGFSSKRGQVRRSLKSQVLNAMGDALGYCLLATPADKTLLPTFLKELINARYGLKLTENDLVEIGKKTLKEELKFNHGSEFYTAHESEPAFVRKETTGPSASVFDVDVSEIGAIWEKLDAFQLYEN
ncbi:MAG: aldehyde ferredoxin oxidoreductase [Proteobacteria bacterium]|nr:aldehyde ferredoxin oxidoreductase [Pseudomonadota bacterium]